MAEAASVTDVGCQQQSGFAEPSAEFERYSRAALKGAGDHRAQAHFTQVNDAAIENNFLAAIVACARLRLDFQALVKRIAWGPALLALSCLLVCGSRPEHFQRSQHANLSGELAAEARNSNLLVDHKDVEDQNGGKQSWDGQVPLIAGEKVFARARK